MARNLVLWLVIAAVLLTIFNNFSAETESGRLSYSDFVAEVQSGRIERVTVDGFTIEGVRQNGDRFETVRPAISDPKLIDDLLEHNVVVEGKMPEQQSLWQQLLVATFPILIIIAIFMFFMRQMQGGAGGKGGPMSFGKSKARMMSEDQIKTTFEDVAGVEEAKEEVAELVDYLRDPGKFQRLGGHIPRGVLMAGNPGTGKTLLAKAIAGEAKVPFFSISGSDFVEMFVGVGASRVRDMFDQAKKHAPCIIFIDEIDAVGRSRGVGLGGGNDEREQTLNQLLVEMDGFEGTEGIIVIAATNRPDVLDPALLRPGRFDRQVHVGLPDIQGREKILKVHMRKVPLGDDVKPELIARGTPGFSGADLANLVNEAALFAARDSRRTVGMEQFEKAKDKIMMGAERRSMVMSYKERLNTAFHEAGHAIVGRLMPEHDPVYKVSIIPRGRALGVTMFLPEEDRYSFSRQGIISQICSLYGGRIAEEMTLGKEGVTTGASNDIQRATQLARNMVTRWGLTDELGPLLYGDEDDDPFGRGMGQPSKPMSGETQNKIDAEVRKIIDECYQKAYQILTDNRDILDSMCEALMTYETISSDQIDQLMARQEVTPPEGWNDSQERVDAVKEEEAANSSESVAESDVPEVDQDDQASQSNEGQSGWGDPQDDQKDEPKQ
ncbi:MULTISPECIES: ATP-dependent zinc metalloprotease FtsH [unclassified Marinobacterium]|jgi:cell division protease FtsH|uniref:ATP-dependent zinc metalloprotease FtsH n=1 Tax=unclassified Marinobacterium TaxID=2644139 RepID=UPI001569A7DF|nr:MULTISPECIES: ATP-dependent zinc metalloprotease FtsH [unclassified Marinobacterium]NRP47492.1 ATP-dependent zinc metalloprotease FtsH [Marinobacterium sp. xm-d-543]NRP60306.1 ATP-dependent zinc metalloprotease FtsH [Marinobacterium sp. xm-d-564]NRP95424.1 ATP-dependent zinc metalloprotease FtsH [Marinobacterium sp. xm-g-59]NRQ01242.1 ATP-dependent zinc metalloprotease FtsH [Marinobacterium sp. xm-d-530]NRQ23923.1 ATP-dependent zinc metalloprotease FtsH [Marinobacterium sp. xm-m-312]